MHSKHKISYNAHTPTDTDAIRILAHTHTHKHRKPLIHRQRVPLDFKHRTTNSSDGLKRNKNIFLHTHRTLRNTFFDRSKNWILLRIIVKFHLPNVEMYFLYRKRYDLPRFLTIFSNLFWFNFSTFYRWASLWLKNMSTLPTTARFWQLSTLTRSFCLTFLNKKKYLAMRERVCVSAEFHRKCELNMTTWTWDEVTFAIVRLWTTR